VVRIRARDITGKIERIHNSEVLRLRGKLLPLVRLADVLSCNRTFKDPATGEIRPDRRNRWSDRRSITESRINEENRAEPEKRDAASDRRENIRNAVKVIVLRLEKNRFGLVVNDVQDSEEIVVKPTPDYIKSSICYAGATIMGDGRVAMILDPNGIASMADLHFDHLEQEIAAEKEKVEKEDSAEREDLLLFSIGGSELFATNMKSIARIEKRSVTEIETIGDREFVKYDNVSLRLFRLERYLPVQSPGSVHNQMFLIVPKGAAHPLGIVTARVEDTVQTVLTIDSAAVRGPGIRGSAIINKRMAVVIDMQQLVAALEGEFA
jgi:two-component system chemotaxis sensor kinase CheA